MTRRGYWIGPALGIILLALAPGPGRASEALRGELAVVAGNVLKFLQGAGQAAIAVGEFTGPPQMDGHAGPGLQEILAAELERLRPGAVHKKAPLSIRGRYAKVSDPANRDLILVKLTAQVFDDQDEVRTEFQTLLRGTQDIAKLLGVTVSLPPNATRADRNERLQERLAEPAVHVDGSLVAARKDSPFAVEVLVKRDEYAPAQPRAARVEGGQAQVDVARGEIYEIRLHNRGHCDAAVTLAIDGLDAFTFSEARDPKTGRPAYSHYVVGPNQSATVVGWHLRDQAPDNYASFLVTEYGKGASAKAVGQARCQVGVITATFALAWTGEPPPEEGNARDAGNETGLGPPRTVDVRPVQRRIGVVRDVVSVRYSR